MEVLITHTSALQYWHACDRHREAPASSQRARKAPGNSPRASALLKGELLGVSMPVEVTVSSMKFRRSSQVFKTHVFTEIMPDRCLVNTNDGFLVASAELCFFQMASQLTLVDLIRLGYELCGSYSTPKRMLGNDVPSAFSNTKYNLKPLTTKKRLTAFVERMSGKHGVKRASRALEYIVDDSGSPMESALAILLVLPFRLGGYGFPLPSMNRVVDPKAIMKRSSNKHYYKCDLFWREFGLAAEYDSALHHSDAKSIANDSIRRGELALSGIEVVTVTDKQLYRAEEFDKVARQLATKMKRRIQIKNAKFTTKHRELRDLLL